MKARTTQRAGFTLATFILVVWLVVRDATAPARPPATVWIENSFNVILVTGKTSTACQDSEPWDAR